MLALVAPLSFGIARLILPPAHALLVGAAIALHPSLIALGAVDLLKDPSIFFATTLVVWAILRSTRERRIGVLVALALAAVVAALYIRTGRFYTFAYLEGAFLGAVILIRLARRRVFERAAAGVLAAGVFVAAEALPMRAGWPPSPVLVAATVSYTLETPGLRQYAMGFFDRFGGRAGGGPRVGPTETRPPALEPGEGLGALLVYPANIFRRLYGPFVWILPSDLRFRALQAGDYFLYPGTLIWYGLIPFAAAGFLSTGWRLLRRDEHRFGLVMLWLFAAVYFLQYLAINLSYRQRDVMLPVTIIFAAIGASWVLPWSRWRRAYAAYWIALAAIAGAHLAARWLLGL
jgi:hypothetical protein